MSVSALKGILMDFTRIEGVSGVAIIGKDGFVVEQVMPAGGVDLDALAAMVTTLYGSATRLGEELASGGTDLIIVEYRNNYVLVCDLGEALFAVLADKRALLGRVRFEMRRQRDRIRAAL